jgi:two-component system, OmpR family, sensor kinase
MRRRFGGLRLRLALVISVVSLGIVAASFVALRASTSTSLRNRIDRELREQRTEFDAAVLRGGVRDPAELARRSRGFVASQRYHARSRIFLVEIPGQRTVTNQPRVLEREAGVLRAPVGLVTRSGEETGKLRVLTQRIPAGGRFHVADPLSPVDQAETDLTHSIVLVGLLALAASVAVGVGVASYLTRPLRRMARVAAAVDAGELDHRIGRLGRRDEVGVLAEAFDNMLDRLRRAFRRQQEFVSDASHELRTPLTVLRGQLELLADEGDPEERRRSIETVLRELDRMNRLVDDMLTLASAESAEILRPREVPIGGFLQDLQRDLPLLGDRDYRVEGIREGTLWADPDRLAQVLRNLVRNAVEVTGEGDRVTVTATPVDGHLELAVSDDGPGIPPEELERVFDRFHRPDEGRDRRRGGAGLGLAMAGAIVEAHGGRIWAESPTRGGTTIRLELPRHSAG